MASLFTRIPAWLYSALNLSEAQLPNQLDVDSVLATLDIGQGGWGDGFFEHRSVTLPASSAAATLELFPGLSDQTQLVHMLSGLHSGGAAALTVNLFIGTGGGSVLSPLASKAVPINAYHYQNEIFTGSFLTLPPDWGLYVDIPATGLGESVTYRGIATRHRRGYKPI